MSESRFTPGPWEVNRDGDGHITSITGPDGWPAVQGTEHATLNVGDEDARLIAASPCLLAALVDLAERCERARSLLRAQRGGNWGILDTRGARAAIAKVAAPEDPNDPDSPALAAAQSVVDAEFDRLHAERAERMAGQAEDGRGRPVDENGEEIPW